MLYPLFFIFIFVVIIQLTYYVFIFGKFSFAKKGDAKINNIAISVLVCAKNNEENVKQFIPLLAKQNYQDFEIVLIDDASSDETLEVFEEFEKQYNNVKLVKVENNEAFWGNKKFALTLGIKAATNEYLLFTDADCYPTSTNWITEMSSCFSDEKTIVLGYSGYHKISGSFLNLLIRFDSVLDVTQYFSWAKIGKPYKGDGKNLAYKKSEFFKTNGFINHMKIRSGCDDLFINEAADSANTAICYSQNSFTFSEPKTSVTSWFTQKRKQKATAKQYKFFDKLQLRLFFISQILVYALAIILLSWQFQWQIVASLFAFRSIFAWISIGYAASKLNEKQLHYWFPFLDIATIFVHINVSLSMLFSKPSMWK